LSGRQEQLANKTLLDGSIRVTKKYPLLFETRKEKYQELIMKRVNFTASCSSLGLQ
jgi:hypothetical protein